MRLFVFSVSTTTPNGPAFRFSSCVLARDLEHARDLADVRAGELLPLHHPLEIITGDFDALWGLDSMPRDTPHFQQLSDLEKMLVVIHSLTPSEQQRLSEQVARSVGEGLQPFIAKLQTAFDEGLKAIDAAQNPKVKK